jgi:hypothetical protein
VYANEEDTIVEAVPVFVANKVDVVEVWRWEEEGKRNVGIEDEGISISPPVNWSV